MTLSDFLTLSCAKGAETISNPSDFSKIIIQGITIQEYPVENFVRPNELVLLAAANPYCIDWRSWRNCLAWI